MNSALEMVPHLLGFVTEAELEERLRIVNVALRMAAGGTNGAAMRMAAELRKRGHVAETWFFYLRRPTYLGEEGVRLLLHHPPRGKARYIRCLIALIQELRAFRPDAVITYGVYANIPGQLGALLAGVPIRVASQRNPSGVQARKVRCLDSIIGSLGLYTANIAVSHAVYNSFEGYPKPYLKRLRVIHNGLAFNQSSLELHQAREKFGLPQQVPLVVNIGRLTQQKNHEILLQALPFLPEVHLAVAGEGELRQTLVQKAAALNLKERVRFLGEIPPGDVPDFLKAGDLFAFPSRWEGLPFALLEAMHAGLPVIASDIPVLREVLGDDEGEPAGLLVPPEDGRAWARAIQRVLEDDNLQAALRSRERRRAALFDFTTMVDGYEQCLREFSR